MNQNFPINEKRTNINSRNILHFIEPFCLHSENVKMRKIAIEQEISHIYIANIYSK